MKKLIKYYIPLILLLVFSLSSRGLGQGSISYTYDNNGNRKTRIFVLTLERSNSRSLPDSDQSLRNFNNSEMINQEVEAEKSQDLQSERKREVSEFESSLKIYPNPTTGIIKISCNNTSEPQKSEYELFDLNGRLILNKKNVGNNYEVDISNFADGIYILKITINVMTSDWKVIKKSY